MTQPAWAGMIETSKIGVIEIAENDPARMGWDDWNNWMRPISMKQKKTQPSRVGMIETFMRIDIFATERWPSPYGLGWLK